MNYLKSHITLVLALISIMMSIFMYRIFLQIFTEYKKNIIDNYSIVIVSNKKINKLNLNKIEEVIPIDITNNLKKLQKEYKNINFKGIKIPYFYRIKLNSLLSPKELNNFKEKLLQTGYITRVMTKSSTQTKIYNLLMLIEITSKTFMFLITILGFLLIIKQLEVWKLEHSERMYIMELFGAPIWFQGASLFKIAFIDSIISVFISTILMLIITHSDIFKQIIKDLNILFNCHCFKEISILFIIALTISLISTIIVVIGKK